MATRPRTGILDESTGQVLDPRGQPIDGSPSPNSAVAMAQDAAERAGVDTGTGGTADITGFASRYTPIGLQQAFENPWFILRDVFPGISVSSPGYQALRDFGADPLVLYNIMRGGSGMIEDQGGAEFVNFMADLYRQLGTRGGQGFSARQLLQNIFNAANATTEEGLAQNTLAAILNAGDQSTQVRTLFNLLRDVSNAAMNPLAASAFQATAAQAGDLYGNAMMRADADQTVNPAVWMQQYAPWLTGR